MTQTMTLSQIGAELMTACRNTLSLYDPQVPADAPPFVEAGFSPDEIEYLRYGVPTPLEIGFELPGILPDPETPDVETLAARLRGTGVTVEVLGRELRVSFLPPQLARPTGASA